MTDSGRKDFGDKVQEKVTPQESKSTVDKVSEGVSGTTDKLQRDFVPDDKKSGGQSLADKTSREKDAHKGDESLLDKAKNTVGLGGNQ